MKRLLYCGVAALLLTLGAGCKKNKQVNLVPHLNVANDLVLSSRPATYVFRMLVKAVADSGLQASNHAVIDFATVTLDAKRQKYTFLFTGSMCADSAWRSGSFTAFVDSGLYHNGTRIKITFLGYAEDGHQVTGADSIISHGLQNGAYQYDSFITGGHISKDSLHSIEFNSVWQIAVTLAASGGGALPVLAFTGSTDGISSGGFSFTSQITSALTQFGLCPWISDGIISFFVSGSGIPEGTIEFTGKTNCSDKIRYDFGGNIYEMRMHEKYLYI